MPDNHKRFNDAVTDFASDDISNVKYPRVKLSVGADGAATDLAPGQATMANSLPVALASNQSALPITDNAGSLTVDGTVSINAIPAGTANIGDVDVLTLPRFAADQTTSTGTLGALNAAHTVAVDGAGAVAFDIASGLVGSVVVEGTIDGSTYITAPALSHTNTGTAGNVINAANPITAYPHRVVVAATGFQSVRLRVSAYTSGSSATAAVRTSSDDPGAPMADNNQIPIAAPVNAMMLAWNPNSNTYYRPTLFDANAELGVFAQMLNTNAMMRVFNPTTSEQVRVRGDATNGMDVDVTRMPERSAQGNYAAFVQVAGTTGAQNIVSIENPAASGRVLRIRCIDLTITAVAATTAAPNIKMGRTTAVPSAGTSQTIQEKNNSGAAAVGIVRSAPTATAASGDMLGAVMPFGTAAINSQAYQVFQAEDPADEIVLAASEGFLVRTDGASDVDFRIGVTIHWLEV